MCNLLCSEFIGPVLGGGLAQLLSFQVSGMVSGLVYCTFHSFYLVQLHLQIFGLVLIAKVF